MTRPVDEGKAITREAVASMVARRPLQELSCHCTYRLAAVAGGANDIWLLEDRCAECLARADAILKAFREAGW